MWVSDSLRQEGETSQLRGLVSPPCLWESDTHTLGTVYIYETARRYTEYPIRPYTCHINSSWARFFFSAKTEDKKFKKIFQLCRSNYNREALQLIFGRCIKEFDTPCHIFSLSRVVFYALGTMLFYIWLQTIQNAPHCWNVICPFATNGTQRICWCCYNQTQFGEMQRWSL